MRCAEAYTVRPRGTHNAPAAKRASSSSEPCGRCRVAGTACAAAWCMRYEGCARLRLRKDVHRGHTRRGVPDGVALLHRMVCRRLRRHRQMGTTGAVDRLRPHPRRRTAPVAARSARKHCTGRAAHPRGCEKLKTGCGFPRVTCFQSLTTIGTSSRSGGGMCLMAE